jgi:hypothetical protein
LDINHNFERDLERILNINQNDINEFAKQEPTSVKEIPEFHTFLSRTYGHHYFNQYFNLFKDKKTNKSLTASNLMSNMCEHYSPEYYEDIMKYEDFVIKNKTEFTNDALIKIYGKLAKLYLIMQKLDPNFKSDKSLFYINEAQKLCILVDKSYALELLLITKALILFENKKFTECLEILTASAYGHENNNQEAISYARGLCYLNAGNKTLAKQNLQFAKTDFLKNINSTGAIWEYPISDAEIDYALDKCK